MIPKGQGKTRPIAQPGFGLPEVYHAIGQIAGRLLPSSETEANQILDFYKRYGPMAKEPFLAACEKTGTGAPSPGPGRFAGRLRPPAPTPATARRKP